MKAFFTATFKKRLITGALVLALAALVGIGSLVFLHNAAAAEGNYYTALNVVAPHAGYGNDRIRFDNLIDQRADDAYLADTVLYRTAPGLPDSLTVSIEGLRAGYTAALVESGGERAFTGGSAGYTPMSGTSSFELVIRSSIGTTVHTLAVNVGFVTKTDLFAGGTGSIADPYLIGNAQQLDHMRLFLNSHFKLNSDIDMAEYRCLANEFYPLDAEDNVWRPIGGSAAYAFRGSLDGSNYEHAIQNLNIVNGALFGYTNKATVKNVKFTDFTVTAASAASAVVVQNATDTIFDKLTLNGNLTARVGGSAAVAGVMTYTDLYKGLSVVDDIDVTLDTVGSSYVSMGGAFYSVNGQASTDLEPEDVRVKLSGIAVQADLIGGGTYVGGIAAGVANVLIEESSFIGSIALANDSTRVGGITGYTASTDFLSNNSAEVTFSQVSGASSNVGGFVGYSDGDLHIDGEQTVTGGFVLGGSGNVGGFAGYVSGMFTVGGMDGYPCSVTLSSLQAGGKNVGGIVGYAASVIAQGNVSVSVAGAITGAENVGGFAGSIPGAADIDTVTVTAHRISGTRFTGGFAGRIDGAAAIESSTVNASLVEGGDYTGGFIGYSGNSLLLNNMTLHATAVKGGSRTGGVIGANAATSVLTVDQSSTIQITSVSGTGYTGGFAGQLYTGGSSLHDGTESVITGGISGLTLIDMKISNTGSYTGGFAGDFFGYAKDITLTNLSVTAGNTLAGGFAGQFAGGADTIDLTVNLSAVSYAGGFAGRIAALNGHPDAVITDVTVLAASTVATTGGYIGGLAGEMTGGFVKDFTLPSGVRFTATPNARMAGGVGNMTGGSITDFTVSVSLTGTQYVGGLVGIAANSNLGSNHTVTANLSYMLTGSPYLGGFAGSTGGNVTVGDENTVNVQISAPLATGRIGGFIAQTAATDSIGEVNSVSGKIISKCGTTGGFIGLNTADIGTGTSVDIEIDPMGYSFTEGAGLVIGMQNGGWVKPFTVSPTTRFISGIVTYSGLIGLANGGTIGGESMSDPLILDNHVTVSGGVLAGTLTGSIRGGHFQNILITGTVTSTGSGSIGALAGGTEGNYGGGTYENITVEASATVKSTGASTVGGLLGGAGFNDMTVTHFTNCVTYNTVIGGGRMGGFIGSMSNVVLGAGCEAYGNVVTLDGKAHTGEMGGFAGTMSNVKINVSDFVDGPKAHGNVYGTESYVQGSTAPIGGFAGSISGQDSDIKFAQAFGSIHVRMGYGGGFVGELSDGKLSNVKTNSELTYLHARTGQQACYFGGVIGQMTGGDVDVKTCVYTRDSIYGPIAGGFVGMIYNGAKLVGGEGEENYQVLTTNVVGMYCAGGIAAVLGNHNRNSADTTLIKNFKVQGTVTSTHAQYPYSGGTGGGIGLVFSGYAQNIIAAATATVTASHGNAGGVFGALHTRSSEMRVNVSNCTAFNTVINNGSTGNSSVNPVIGIIAESAGIGSILVQDCISEAGNTVIENIASLTLTIDSSAVVSTVPVSVGETVDVVAAFTGGTYTLGAEVISGNATASVSIDTVTVKFLKTGNVVVRLYATEKPEIFKEIIFTVVEPVPDAATFTTGSYTLGDWSTTDVTVTPQSNPLSDYFSLQIFFDGEWQAFTDPSTFTFTADGTHELRLRYVETDGDAPMPEFFAGLIRIEKPVGNFEIVYNTYETADGIQVVVDKSGAISGTVYEYSFNNSDYETLAEITTILVPYGETLYLRAKRGIDTGYKTATFAALLPTPEVSELTLTTSYTEETWATSDIVIYLSASNLQSGMYYAYQIEDGTVVKLSQAFLTVNVSVDELTYTFILFDKYDRELDSESIVIQLDKANPTLSVALPASGTLIDGDYEATLTVTNAPVSGIAQIQLWQGGTRLDDIDPDTLKFTVTENGDYKVILIDGAGRTFTHKFTVDFLKRGDIETFAYSGLLGDGEWATSVTLTFTCASENIDKFEYSRNGIGWATMNTYPYFTVTENGTYHFRVTDSSGVSCVINDVEVQGIDRVVPALFVLYDSTSMQGGNPFTVSYITGSSGVQSLTYTLNGGEVQDILGVTDLRALERGTYKFVLTNGAGVSVSRVINVTKLDNNTSLTLTVDTDETKLGNWSKEDLTFTLSIAEEVFVPLTYYYTINDGDSWMKLTGNTLVVSGNVIATYKFKAEIETGPSAISGAFEVMVDSLAPIIVLESVWDNDAKNVDFTIFSANTVCGYKTYYRQVGAGSWNEIPGFIGIPIPDSGFVMYEFRIVTELGLTAEVTGIKVVLDNAAPVLQVDYDHALLGTWQQSFTFTLTNEAEQTSGTEFQYSKTGEEETWVTIDSVFTVDFSYSGNLYFRAVSGANKVSNYVTVGIVMVDRTAAVQIIDSGSGYTKEDVVLNMTFRNEGSGFTSIIMKLPGGATAVIATNNSGAAFQFIHTAKENGTYEFYITNRLGVSKTVTYTVDRIDKVAPSFSVTPVGVTAAWTKDTVMIGLKPNENARMPISGIQFQYSIGNDVWHDIGDIVYSINDSVTLTADIPGNVTYELRAVSGTNVITVGSSVNVWFDAVTPELTVTARTQTEKSSNVQFDLSAVFGGSGGAVYVSVGGVAYTIGSSVYEAKTEGIYVFYAVSDTGVRSLEETKVIVFPKYSGVVDSQKYSENVELFAQNYAKIIVYKDLKDVSAAFVNGTERFTSNGSYVVELYGESGNVITISFIIDKPNYPLIFGIIGAAVVAITVVTVLVILYIRKSRAFKRFVAASTVSDDSNDFVMLRRIK